jgi:hypothetical protein
MNILFCGSRSFKLNDTVVGILNEEFLKLSPTDTIIHGGAEGIDSIVDTMARQKRFRIVVYKPEWNKYGVHSAVIRDRLMVEQSDRVVAIWDCISKGTIYTYNYAKMKGKEVNLIKRPL